MTSNVWMREVLLDLASFAKANSLPKVTRDLEATIATLDRELKPKRGRSVILVYHGDAVSFFGGRNHETSSCNDEVSVEPEQRAANDERSL